MAVKVNTIRSMHSNDESSERCRSCYFFSIDAPQRNCSINGSVVTSDKQIIQSFPFPVAINPSNPRPSPPRFSYAIVNICGQVTELTLVNIPSIPLATFRLKRLQALSLLDSYDLSIPREINLLTPSLQSLTISKISASLTLPAELFNLTLLSTLSIVSSGLMTLSEDIINLQQLTELTLDQNLLVTLPSALGKLPSLTLVSVNGNRRLSSLDALSASISLATLQASNCAIDHLPSNISTLSSIVMDDNQLTSLDGIETMTSSTSDLWSFTNNKITLISSASLEKIIVLKYFYLSNNQLSTLPDTLYQVQGLQTLDVRNNNFDKKETEWIQGLFRLTNATVLI